MSEAKEGAHFCYLLAQHKCELNRFIKNIFQRKAKFWWMGLSPSLDNSL